MPSTRTRPSMPPTDVKLPPDVTSTRATLSNGAIAYSFRHARLGLLGRLVISALGDQTQVTSELSGDADDPMIAARLAIFRPISEALTAILDHCGGGDPATYAARGTDTPAPQPPGPDANHLVQSKLVQCDRCDAFVAHIVFADEATGTMEDHARLMYGRIRELGLPTWVLGPIHERGRRAGQAELLAVYPAREPTRWVTEAEFDAMMDAITGVHCVPTEADALDLLPDPANPGPGLDVTAQVNARVRRRAEALPPATRRTLGDLDRLTPETLQALLVPSAVAEAQARYRASYGRGVLLCDNIDGRGSVRFWYVRPRETPGVLVDAPAETRADVAAMLQVYDPKAEAIIVLRLPHAIQAVYVQADGTMRAAGLVRLGPRLAP
jgi:hypothetical protein